ncbi:MAG: cobyrinate a,c-diamide synthase [Clostridia bacterium]|nr:cobyrinate a,c-diamide synthase [Clostridia bacterium]
MNKKVPRIVIAGTGSGCGKTTVSCAVLQALVNRRLNVGAFKCGPDYIDPMFHSRIIGTECSNLDPFFFDDITLKNLLIKNSRGCDVSVIEGVMGFYDGMSMHSEKASTYEVSKITKSPVLLVVDAKGAAFSALAVIHGFMSFLPDNSICGVILNRCTSGTYKMLAAEIEKQFGNKIMPIGFLPKLPDCTIESRHLGLVTADEIKDLKRKLEILAKQAEETIEIDKILKIAENAEAVEAEETELPKYQEKVRIAVAKDNAFCFYYKDSLNLLKELGAEIVEFSPVSDAELPENIHGIYFGGGYPELYKEKLSANKKMLASVKKALQNNLPCVAECGGFMYLKEYIGEYPMVGYLKGKCFDNKKLTRFGYITLTAKTDNMLCRRGEKIRAHEFHYWDTESPGEAFSAEKTSGKRWDCIFASETLYAGYPHLHFLANRDFAINFYEACLKEKRRYD